MKYNSNVHLMEQLINSLVERNSVIDSKVCCFMETMVVQKCYTDIITRFKNKK